MIVSFKDKETERIFRSMYSKRFPIDIQRKAYIKLKLLDAATCVDDLKIPPGNRFEFLQGDFKGACSIRVNKQYRLCFRITDGFRLCDVLLIDYH